jgi:hypothetical protein
MHLFATTTSEQALEMGKAAAFHEVQPLETADAPELSGVHRF